MITVRQVKRENCPLDNMDASRPLERAILVRVVGPKTNGLRNLCLDV